MFEKMKTEQIFAQIKKNYPKARERHDLLQSPGHREYEIDGLYRIYHQSFKMYWELQEAIIDYLNVLFALAGVGVVELKQVLPVPEKLQRTKKHYGSIEHRIKNLELEHFFTRSVLEALAVEFEDNDEDKWHNHQQTLAAGLHHAKTAVGCIMGVSQNYFEKDELPGKKGGVLNPDGAVFVAVLNLNDYRYVSEEEVKDRIRRYENEISSIDLEIGEENPPVIKLNALKRCAYKKCNMLIPEGKAVQDNCHPSRIFHSRECAAKVVHVGFTDIPIKAYVPILLEYLPEYVPFEYVVLDPAKPGQDNQEQK